MAFTIPSKDANNNVPTDKDKTQTPTPEEITVPTNSSSSNSSEILDDDLDKEYREKQEQ